MSKSTPALKLGKSGPDVYPMGLGLMGLSGIYGKVNDEASVATILHAIDRGVTLLDTGDFYGMGHNEFLLRRALEARRSQRDQLQISVKFGALRGPDNSWGGIDTRPAAIKNFVAYSLQRLNVDVIDIYRPARLDPNVPIEETVGAIADLIKAGYVRHVGLSEMGVETIRRAQKVHPIVDLQIEYSLVTRKPEEAIFPVLHELGISATLYGVLSRGLLSGRRPHDASDMRAHLPRFSQEHAPHNQVVINAIGTLAQRRNTTSAQLVMAYVAGKQPRFLPLIGAKTIAQVDEAIAAVQAPLSAEEIEELERAVPSDSLRGGRYADVQMKHLDSER